MSKGMVSELVEKIDFSVQVLRRKVEYQLGRVNFFRSVFRNGWNFRDDFHLR